MDFSAFFFRGGGGGDAGVGNAICVTWVYVQGFIFSDLAAMQADEGRIHVQTLAFAKRPFVFVVPVLGC